MSAGDDVMAPGAVIADRRLVVRLGQGGEGEVWEARRPDGSTCALKLIRPSVLPPPDEVRRRGRWLVRIDHPAMVTVSRGGRFTGGALAGWGFVEMELIVGPSLQDAPPLPHALSLLAPVADALDLLHAGAWSDGVPLIHRDVKPGNLIGAADGLVLVDPSTMRGLDTTDLTRIGTPAYLAPEVMSGRFGPLADVYSLAATGIALLTGLRGAALTAVLDRAPDHDLPHGLVAAVRVEPARRPGTCAAALSGPAERIVVSAERRDALGEPGEVRPQASAGPGWAVVALTAILVAPAVAVAVAGNRTVVAGLTAAQSTAVTAAVGHLVVHALTRRLGLAIVAPPWAWGSLIAGLGHADTVDDSVVAGRRRWLADVVAGLLLIGAGVVVGVAAGPLRTAAIDWLGSTRPVYPITALAVVVLVVLAVRSATVAGRIARALVWTLWLPVRLVGAVPRVVITGGRR